MRMHTTEHRMLTWEEFTSTLQSRFPTYNEQHTARTEFYACKQLTSQPVEAYVARLKELAGRCIPSIQDVDMLHRFSEGLVRDMRVNPITGTLWESFDHKAAYIIANQNTLHTSNGHAHVPTRYTVKNDRHSHQTARLKSARMQGGSGQGLQRFGTDRSSGGRGRGDGGRGPYSSPTNAWAGRGGRDGGRGRGDGGGRGGSGGRGPGKRDGDSPSDRLAKRSATAWETNPQFAWYAKLRGCPDAPCHKCSHPPQFVQHTNAACDK
jgi:hypothetical protein